MVDLVFVRMQSVPVFFYSPKSGTFFLMWFLMAQMMYPVIGEWAGGGGRLVVDVLML